MKHTLIRLGGLTAMVGDVVYAGVGLVEDRIAEYLYYMGNIGQGPPFSFSISYAFARANSP